VSELAKLRDLSSAERRWLALCLLAMPAVVFGLGTFGFARMRSWLQRWPGRRTPGPRGPEDAERARAIARVVGVVAGRGPVHATCLRRALLVSWILRREGIASALRIGVRREGDELLAHAWVEHDGVPLGEDDDPALRYAAFDRNFGLTADALP